MSHPQKFGPHFRTPLDDYVDGGDDPINHRRVSLLRLPTHAYRYRDAGYRGDSPHSLQTSMLVGGSDGSHDSLPSLNHSRDSLAVSSTHTSMAERDITRRTRVLEIGLDNSLLVDGRPRTLTVLQCPFQILGCQLDFSDFDVWFWHSIKHFRIGYPKHSHSRHAQGPAVVMPPRNNQCCFCQRSFNSASGLDSWWRRMHHLAFHHRTGHTLAHARPDFLLFDYLWENHLIDEIDYRELKGNTADGSRLTGGNPSPPTSDTSGSPPPTPRISEGRAVAVVNERRHDRRRR